MPINSRNKGKAGEREIINALQPIVDKVYEQLRRYWVESSKDEKKFANTPKLQRNTLACDGGGYDVVGLDWLALEIKRDNQMSVKAMWLQAVKQTQPGQLTALVYRRDQGLWRARVLATLQIRQHCTVDMVVELSYENWLLWFEKELYEQVGHYAWSRA